MSKNMGLTDLQLSYEAIGEILRSEEVQSVCNSYANQMCGSDQHVKSFTGFDRCHALIYNNTKEYPG